MLIYNYSRTTFELVGGGVEAKLDPIGKNPMIPAFATSVEPPSVSENQVAVFDKDSNTWSLMDDFRGTTYYNDQYVSNIIRDIGEMVPGDCTTEEPPENPFFYNMVGGSWVFKSIEEIREIKISQLYNEVARTMNTELSIYASIEMDTWSKMYDECVKYQEDGTIGPLMTSKISVDPEYNTADKLATMTVTEYQTYINKKFNLEAQRSQHKININNIGDANTLINYDVSVSIQ